MKRYLLFRFEQYYPNGGWNDFAGDFDTIDSAMKSIPLTSKEEREGSLWENWQIVDTHSKEIVRSD